MRKLAWLVAVVSLLASGTYVFVYLYRWEWHRALLVGVLFIAAEVALATALVLRALSRRATAPGPTPPAPEPVPLDPDDRAARSEAFAWLRGEGGFGVFMPVLLGRGAVVSAVAWAVGRITSRGSGRSAADALTARLAPLSFPEKLFVEHPELPEDRVAGDLSLLVRPHGDRR